MGILNELADISKIQKMRKEDIKSHFGKILRKAKTSEQINGFYEDVISMIKLILNAREGVYNYEGFNFWEDDILLLDLILEEHNLKRNILKNL